MKPQTKLQKETVGEKNTENIIISSEFEPKVLISGSQRDLKGLTEPVHMCSNCWNNKSTVM